MHGQDPASVCIATWRRALLAAVCGFALVTAAAQTPVEPRRTLRLSAAVGTAFALGKAAERWATIVREKSGGTLDAALRPGAVLAGRDAAREFIALRDGDADLAVGSSLYWSLQVPALNVVGLPWIAPDASALAALVTAVEVQGALAAAVRAAGVEPLAFAPLGHREIASVGTPVRTPADIAGRRVRITSTPYLVDFYAGLGARPEALPFAEALPAFESGRLDAQDGSLAALAAARFDVAGVRDVTLWGAVAEVAIFAVNRAVWEGWNEREREVVAAAARDAAAELPALARAENEGALAALAQRGVAILRLTASGRAAFAAAARPVYDKWAGVAGEELVRAVQAAAKSAR